MARQLILRPRHGEPAMVAAPKILGYNLRFSIAVRAARDGVGRRSGVGRGRGVALGIGVGVSVGTAKAYTLLSPAT